MDKQKICFVINTLEVGGAAKMIKSVANVATDIYEEVYILSLYHGAVSYNDLKGQVIIYNLEVNHVGLTGRIEAAYKIRQQIKKIRPKVVCSFVTEVCVTSFFATLGLRHFCKFVTAERGDPNNISKIWLFLTRLTYNHADYCFFQLQSTRDFFGESVSRKSFVIPNAFPEKGKYIPFHGVRKKTIVSVGRLYDSQKCYSLLIRSFGLIHKKHPEYKLIIYGDGQDKDYLQQLIIDLNLENFAFLPGAVGDPIQMIREDGIFVLSSLYEGIPNSLIEALSIGIPTVTTDCSPGGAAFLTKNGENALLIPTNDIEAMTKAILRIIETPDLAMELSKKAPAIIQELDPLRIDKMWATAFGQISAG